MQHTLLALSLLGECLKPKTQTPVTLSEAKGLRRFAAGFSLAPHTENSEIFLRELCDLPWHRPLGQVYG